MTDSAPQPASRPRRWTILAAAFLLLALAAVVLYTREGAFRSPMALVVVAAIGIAALLMQIRYRPDTARIRSSSLLNLLGLICAVAAIFADVLHQSPTFMLVAALVAVFCFGVSGFLVLRAFRRRN